MRSRGSKAPVQAPLVILSAFLPLFRGGHPLFAQLTVSGALIFLCGWRFAAGLRQGTLRLLARSRDYLFPMIALSAAGSLFRPLAPPDAFFSFGILMAGIIFFLWVRRSAFFYHEAELIFAMGVITALVGIFGFFQLTGFVSHAWWIPRQFMASTFVNHNHFSAYLEVLLPVLLAFCFAAPAPPFKRIIAGGCSLVISGALLLSCSRGAWLSLLLSTGLGFLLFGRQVAGRRAAALKILMILGAVTGAVFLAAHRQQILGRLLSFSNVAGDASFQTRLAIWRGTWQMLRENFWLGSGFGSFVYAFPYFRPAGLYWLVNYAHNEYFQTLAEMGLPALLSVLCFGIFLYTDLLQLIRQGKMPWERALGFGGWIAVTSFLLHSAVDFPWHVPASAFQFLAVAGLVAGTSGRAGTLHEIEIRLPFKRWQASLAGVCVAAVLGLSAFFLGGWVFADIQASRGGLERSKGDYERAAHFYKRAAERLPFRSEYFRNLGHQYASRAWQISGNEHFDFLKKAQEAYRQAWNLTPADTRNAYALAGVSMELGDLRGAEPVLARLVLEDPEDPRVWEKAGELELIRGNSLKAFKNFQQVLKKVQPHYFPPNAFDHLKDPDFFSERGEAALKSTQWKLARSFFEVALASGPDNARAKTGLAILALSGGDFAGAEKQIENVREPELKADGFAAFAQETLKRGQVEETRAALDKSLQLDSGNIWAHQIQCLLAKKTGDAGQYQEAEKKLLALNKEPLFSLQDKAGRFQIIWNPEYGVYASGNRKYNEGWILTHNGALSQSLALPVGKVSVSMRVLGTLALGRGPMMIVSWAGRKIYSKELMSGAWTELSFPAFSVAPGESVMKLEFKSDYKDPRTGEDRNLIIGKGTITGEAR